jgi:hypothetical protein
MSFDFIDRKFGQRPRDQPTAAEECPTCCDGGWRCYGTGSGDPHFEECPTCHNPNDYPCP